MTPHAVVPNADRTLNGYSVPLTFPSASTPTATDAAETAS